MKVDQRLHEFIVHMPKVELHVHLEGSIRPDTLLELARRRRVDLPADSAEGLREWFRFRDFEHFVHIYLTCCRCLRDPEDFQLVLDQFLAEQARQSVLYSEVHLTIGTHLANGVNGREVADALRDTLEASQRRHGVRARLITDIVRDLGPQRADRTLEWALDCGREMVVALGLSGFESSADEPFREHFRVAREQGLHRVAHAGEHEGPETIRSVLEVVEAERIGHGIRAVDDPGLLAMLAGRRLPLEVCPTSNVRLGAVPRLEEHPFDRLRRAGVVVTVNADDPLLFGTTLNDEYLLLAETFGYGPADLAELALNALRSSFLEDSERTQLSRDLERRLSALGVTMEGDGVRVDSEATAREANRDIAPT